MKCENGSGVQSFLKVIGSTVPYNWCVHRSMLCAGQDPCNHGNRTVQDLTVGVLLCPDCLNHIPPQVLCHLKALFHQLRIGRGEGTNRAQVKDLQLCVHTVYLVCSCQCGTVVSSGVRCHWMITLCISSTSCLLLFLQKSSLILWCEAREGWREQQRKHSNFITMVGLDTKW